MSSLRRSVLLCAILIYCVAGVQSQSEDYAVPIEDSLEDGISYEYPEGSVETSTILSDRRRIVGGVDDERSDIREICPIRVNPTPRIPNLSTPLECARSCNARDRPRTCYYRFEAEMYYSVNAACEFCHPNVTNGFCNNCQCVPVDGVERAIMTINRMIPGPSIDVCEGDKIVVDVINTMEGEGLTIHWHGILQKGTQYYDGPLLVTQCPIPPENTFRYQFDAVNPGTHFWHAHTGLQKLDGIFGSLTIRQTPRRDINSHLYDFDLSRHSVLINDWMHELASSRMPGRLHDNRFQSPDIFLINGKGQYKDPVSGNITASKFEVFHVRRNARYRFRMVNAFCTTCSTILTVQNHNLTIIAADGIPVRPTVVTSIISVAGERYDFIINTNNQVDSYWIQLRGIATCKNRGIQQLAILQYEGASVISTSSQPTFNTPLPEGIILNPLDSQCNLSRTDAICVSNLDSAVPVDRGILREKPDAKFYIGFSFHQYNATPDDLFMPNTFQKFIIAGEKPTAATVNGISFRFPSSPPLTQMDDILPETICNSTHKPKECTDKKCSCTHIIELPYNGIIELIIVDETIIPNLHHPFHLHGYAFNIMATGVPNNGNGTTVKEVEMLDQQGLLPRKTLLPPFKDTVAVPNRGYAIIRFRANNPGYWFFHCHFIYHVMLGMSNVFHVGEPSDLPPVPPNFPKCGNFMPPISN